MEMTYERATLLEFDHVTKHHLGQGAKIIQVLDDVSFEIKQGEFLSIIGPSGCGKSTMLRLAAGLDFPTFGMVKFQGSQVFGTDRRRGIVFQAYNAFPWLRVRENIGFGLQDTNKQHKQEKVNQWLKATGLTNFADAYPKTLSGGMLQRLALARTMICEPQLLLLDEPFGALDERTRKTMQHLLQETIKEHQCSVLMVTHDIREAILLADRIVLLSNRPGQILQIFQSPFGKEHTRTALKAPEFNQLYEKVLNVFPDSESEKS